MVQFTPQMIQVLLQCKMLDDEESYNDLRDKFIEKHIVELKLEALKNFLNDSKKVKVIYDGNKI